MALPFAASLFLFWLRLKASRRRGSATEESRMKLSTRYAIFVIAAAVLFAAALTLFSAPSGAQDDGWTIMRAEYGTRARHKDVTDIVKDLVGSGGVNGRVAVNNQTMGGDPTVGAEKHLRIRARNRKYGEREFDYREGGFVEVATFAVRRDRGDWNDRPDNYGDRDRDGEQDLRIVRAYYGWQGSTEIGRASCRESVYVSVGGLA